jgi:hypothetical protein
MPPPVSATATSGGASGGTARTASYRNVCTTVTLARMPFAVPSPDASRARGSQKRPSYSPCSITTSLTVPTYGPNRRAFRRSSSSIPGSKNWPRSTGAAGR